MKNMKVSLNTQVGEVVKGNFKTATLFQDHNIDFCCGGGQSIFDACQKAGVDAEEFVGLLEEVLQEADPDAEYINGLSLDELSEYIVKRHHAYVHKNLPFLKQNLDKIADVHGGSHPELYKVRDMFYESAGELIMHMQKEELMLFPYVKRLVKAKATGEGKPKSPFGSVSNPIAAMLAEHQNEGDRFVEISRLTDNYRVPADGCTTYEITFRQLSDFEKDLHRHIHLENNILFPKAIELENSL